MINSIGNQIWDEIWHDTCPTCGRSGVTCTFHAGPVYKQIKQGCECDYFDFAKSLELHSVDKCENEETCPTCKGTGKVMLTVEREAPSKSVHKRWLAQGCNERPLTRGEVEEIKNDYSGVANLLGMVQEEDTYYKGQPVHLRPYKED